MTTAPMDAAVSGNRPHPHQGPPVWWGLDQVPAGLPRSVVTLGMFDGVHRGHARLIGCAVRRARFLGAPTVLVTFDPHPARVLGLQRDTAALTTVTRRAELVGHLGVDAVLVLPFSPDLAALEPEEFVDRVLDADLNAVAVVVGANFTFGARGTGTVDTLDRLGPGHGFTTHAVGLLRATDEPCSSTYTRDCVRRGDLAEATAALGRPHEIDGELRGDTVLVPDNTAVPPPGTYLVTVRLDGRAAPGRTIEVAVLDDRRVRLLDPAYGRTAPREARIVFTTAAERR